MKSTPSKASDLQRLVEEIEEPEEERVRRPTQRSLSESDMENRVVSVTCETVNPYAHLPDSIKMALVEPFQHIHILITSF